MSFCDFSLSLLSKQSSTLNFHICFDFYHNQKRCSTLQDRCDKELHSLQQEVEQERVKLQEAEVRRIKNLEEAVELSSQQLQSFKKKKVAIKVFLFISLYLMNCFNYC